MKIKKNEKFEFYSDLENSGIAGGTVPPDVMSTKLKSDYLIIIGEPLTNKRPGKGIPQENSLGIPWENPNIQNEATMKGAVGFVLSNL